MSTPFSRTLRALDADHGLGPLAMGLAALLLVGWTAWMGLSRVTVYVRSEAARLESAAVARPVEAEVGGRVVAVFGQLGDPVLEGDPLVELDSSAVELQMQAVDARQSALAVEVEALSAVVAAEEAAAQGSTAAAGAAQSAAAARLAEAEAQAQQAEAEAAAVPGLVASGSLSAQAGAQLQALAAQRRSAAVALRSALAQIAEEGVVLGADRQGGLARAQQALAQATGELTAAQAELQRLDNLIERHQLRAPVDGQLGALRPLHPGDLVDAGDAIGVVIPTGELSIVARFGPADLGQLVVGAPARLRLDAFPWTVYGSLPATVTRVASEPLDGGVAVVLTIEGDPGEIPLQHGLTGEVEVAVDEMSPARLLLRAAGAPVGP